MCIIAYAPRGQQIKEETIRIMFRGNPHGAGIMWKPTDSSQVEIRKGFMKVDELLRAYNEIPVECEKAIHCRIATAGKISVGCCHPFPVRAKTNAMKQAQDSAYVALMHNGIINYCNPVGGMQADYSDTMVFASQILYPLQKQLDTAAIQMLIENSTNSRLLIFRKDAETLMFGNWKYEDGIYYSNDNYKERTYNYNGFRYGGNYYGSWEDCYGLKNKSTAKTTTKKADKKEEEKKQEEKEPSNQVILSPSGDFYDSYDEMAEDEWGAELPPSGTDCEYFGTLMVEVPEAKLDKTATEIKQELVDILADNGYFLEFTAHEFEDFENDNTVLYLTLEYTGFLPKNTQLIGDYKVIDNDGGYI